MIVCEPAVTKPENGAVTCTNENNKDSSCTFTCDVGFELSSVSAVTCERSSADGDWEAGQWSTVVPTCNGNSYTFVLRYTEFQLGNCILL